MTGRHQGGKTQAHAKASLSCYSVLLVSTGLGSAAVHNTGEGNKGDGHGTVCLYGADNRGGKADKGA